MTAVENLVALYGAILATILAYIQYRRWHKSTEIISASPIGEFGKVGDHLELAISNKGTIRIFVSFVGIGFCYRPWFRPWVRRSFEISGMRLVEDDFITDKQACDEWMQPGQTFEACFDSRAFTTVEKPPLSKGFLRQLVLWIDHSGSDQPYIKKLVAKYG